MSLFVCSKCKNIENTALCGYWFKEEKLCRFCEKGIDGETENGKISDNWEYLDNNFVVLKELNK